MIGTLLSVGEMTLLDSVSFSVQWCFCINLAQCSREISVKILLGAQRSARHRATPTPVGSSSLRLAPPPRRRYFVTDA